MHRTTLRPLVLLTLAMCVLIAGVLGLSSGTVSAHNTLLTSDPADGAVLTAAPTQITWQFDKAVPLETMTVTLIDASGARRELSGSMHGAAGATDVVVTPLPTLAAGALSLRWRLVGPDGHPITGRVDVTIAAPIAATTAPAAAVPTTPTDTIAPIANPTAVDQPTFDEGDGSYSTPSFVRWILRYASYLAIIAVVGILLTGAYVWSGAGGHPLLRRILSCCLVGTAALAFLQLLVVASDVSGALPWSSFGSIDAATTTDAGMSLAIRIVLALSMWLVVFHAGIVHREVYWTAVSLPGLGLLATWAFAGHSRSMRWPGVGVVADVAHHAAAAAWIAGLAVVGGIVIPTTAPDVVMPIVRRFSRVAAISVALLVVTGLVQTVRLVGSPMDLLDANHGRYLLAKVVVLAAMLGVASLNRRRVEHRLDDPTAATRHASVLRRAVLTEFGIGLAIVAITASMVVSPPSSNRTGASGAPRRTAISHILHDVVIPLERPT